ncbi:hypothetical protein IHEIED_03985 [Methylorubrum populi]
MSPPRLYRAPEPEIRMARCACGCGGAGPFGFPGGLHFAFRHWPDGFVVLDARGHFTGRAPAIPAGDAVGAPVDLFGLTESPQRLTNRPPSRTGRRGA